MNIIRQKSSQIILLKHEQLPLALLSNRKYAEQFIQQFSFAQLDQSQDPSGATGLIFSKGLYVDGKTTDIAINRLSFENRKVVIAIEGPTSCIEKIWNNVRDACLNISSSTDEGFLKPVWIANESEVIANLDFPASALFSSPINKFFEKEVISITSSSMVKSNIGAKEITIAIDFNPQTESFGEWRINLSRKEFTIKTAIGYPISEQVYSSSGPVDSENNVALLKSLEKKLNKPK